MVDYYNVTTNTGDAEIAAAIASNTKLAISHIAFGDGNGAVPTPSKTRTTLVREVHRQAVTKYERHPTNANWLLIETIIPSTIGGFTIREMGVIANGKMISHGSHAPFEKVADPSGVSEYRLKFTQNITDGSVIEITLDESLIYASQAWVEENFIKRSEIIDNLTTDDATKPVSAKQAKILQDNKLDKNDNAASATKLQTMRIISFSGAATGSLNFDGSTNSSAILTLANSGVIASTYGSNLKIPILTVNAKGLITGVSEQTIPIVDNLTTDDANKPVSAKQAKILQDNKLDKNDNAASATKLQTMRIISFSGAATGSLNFDGSTNSSAILTLANSGVIASTYGSNLKIPILTVNAKGLITGVSEQTIPIVDNLTTDDANKPVSAKQAKVLNDQAFGVNQDYVDVTSQRVNGTIYTVTGSKPKSIYINVDSSTNSSTEVFFVRKNSSSPWIGLGQRGNGSRTVFATISPTYQYKYDSTTGFSKWVEGD